HALFGPNENLQTATVWQDTRARRSSAFSKDLEAGANLEARSRPEFAFNRGAPRLRPGNTIAPRRNAASESCCMERHPARDYAPLRTESRRPDLAQAERTGLPTLPR